MSDTAGIYDDGGWYGEDRPDFPSQTERDAIDADGTGDGIYDDGATYGPNCTTLTEET